VPKPAGRVFTCPHCGQGGHRDLIAAANIAARDGGGTIPAIPTGAGITHRRAGRHLPGVHPARRDPRRGPPSRPAATGPLAGTGPPRAPTQRTESRSPHSEEHMSLRQPLKDLCVGALADPGTRLPARVALSKCWRFGRYNDTRGYSSDRTCPAQGSPRIAPIPGQWPGNSSDDIHPLEVGPLT
jgi:Putative transposase DNA-binding domain